MVLLVTRNDLATAGVLGFILTVALPTAWAWPSGWLVTSASTLSIGSVVMLSVARTTCRERRSPVALALSFRSCAACGDGVPDGAGLAVEELPDAPGVEDVAVEDFFPHPVTNIAKSAAVIRIAIAPRCEGL